jgi:hypothetical protein
MRNKLNQVAVAIALDIAYSDEDYTLMPNIFKRIFATCWICTHTDAYQMFVDKLY